MMKALDIVLTPEGVAFVKKVKKNGMVIVRYVNELNKKNGYNTLWEKDELEMIDSIPRLIYKNCNRSERIVEGMSCSDIPHHLLIGSIVKRKSRSPEYKVQEIYYSFKFHEYYAKLIYLGEYDIRKVNHIELNSLSIVKP